MCSCGCELAIVVAEKRLAASREAAASPDVESAARPPSRAILARLAEWLAGRLAGGDPALRGSR